MSCRRGQNQCPVGASKTSQQKRQLKCGRVLKKTRPVCLTADEKRNTDGEKRHNTPKIHANRKAERKRSAPPTRSGALFDRSGVLAFGVPMNGFVFYVRFEGSCEPRSRSFAIFLRVPVTVPHSYGTHAPRRARRRRRRAFRSGGSSTPDDRRRSDLPGESR